jgi:hypothetical protein
VANGAIARHGAQRGAWVRGRETGKITGDRFRYRRPQRERGAYKEKENDDTCFSVTIPDGMHHAGTPDTIFSCFITHLRNFFFVGANLNKVIFIPIVTAGKSLACTL